LAERSDGTKAKTRRGKELPVRGSTQSVDCMSLFGGGRGKGGVLKKTKKDESPGSSVKKGDSLMGSTSKKRKDTRGRKEVEDS